VGLPFLNDGFTYYLYFIEIMATHKAPITNINDLGFL